MAGFGKQLDVMLQVRRISKQLNAVADKCAAPVEDVILGQAGLLAVEQRSLAPVDPTSDTPGALKDSIRVERGTPTAKKSIVVKINAGGKETLKAGKDSKPYDYGRAVEFGTQDMPAQPFFFPIYRARKKDIKAATRKAIKLAVKDVFK